MKQISIIIPMYNSEKTIERCIDSILHSATEDVEIIVVDDCSIDNSFEICKQKYSNKIKLFKNNFNKGPSFSRNKGMESADGEYICFVDSDDYVSEDYCKVLLENIKSKQDIYFFDYDRKGRKESDEKFPLCRRERIVFLIENNLFSSSWNKIFRKSLIWDSGQTMCFNISKKYGEDEEFYINLFNKIETMQYISKRIYFYIFNEGSLITQKQSIDTLCDVYEYKRNFLIKEGVFENKKLLRTFSLYNMYMLYKIQFKRNNIMWKDSKKMFWYLSFTNKLRFIKYLISSRIKTNKK